MENSIGNTNKTPRKTGKNDKAKGKHGNMLGQERKSNTKNSNTTWEIKKQVIVKEGRFKIYRQRVKPYRQNRIFQNNERKFYQKVGGNGTKNFQQRDAREIEQFGVKFGNQEDITKNRRYMEHGKRVRRTGIRTESRNTHRFIHSNTKNIKSEKQRAIMENVDSGSRNSPTFTTEKHSKWTDAYKKDKYLNSWPKDGPHWSKNTP